jgi:hypothetical protein
MTIFANSVTFYQPRPFDYGKSVDAFCKERGIRRQDIANLDEVPSGTLEEGQMLVLNCPLPRRTV